MSRTYGVLWDPNGEIPHLYSQVSIEDALIDRITVDGLLETVPEADRALLWLRFAVRRPDGYRGAWPATLREIGEYVGIRYNDGPLSERVVRYRTRLVLKQLQHRFARPSQRPERNRTRRGGR